MAKQFLFHFMFSFSLFFTHQWNTFPKLVAEKNKETELQIWKKAIECKVLEKPIDSHFKGKKTTKNWESVSACWLIALLLRIINKNLKENLWLSSGKMIKAQNCGAIIRILRYSQTIEINIRALSQPHYFFYFLNFMSNLVLFLRFVRMPG